VGAFLQDFVSTRGAMEVTSSEVMNPFAGGGSNNLYRCFIDLSFRLVAPSGSAALIHQDGHLGDPKSGAFRRHWYARVAKHFEFINRMKSRNFMEVDHNVRFSLNIYRGEERAPDFEKFTYAFTASQVEDSYTDRYGSGPVPSIKNSEGTWDTRGHRDRVIRIDREALSVIHDLSEEASVPVEEARFIQPFSAKTVSVFEKLSKAQTIDSGVSRWQMSLVMLEAEAQKRGFIKKQKNFPALNTAVLQGPMFHVGNPVYKSARAVGWGNNAYDPVDLFSINDDYFPRVNFLPAVSASDFLLILPRCRWEPERLHVDRYRVAFRAMVNLNSERSLIPAIVPPGVAHVNAVESLSAGTEAELITLHASLVAITSDFFIKAAGKTHFHVSDAKSMRFVDAGPTAGHRGLRLGCLTSAYADLWNRNAHTLDVLPWSSPDHRLRLEGLVEGPATWDRTAGLRTEFARRMALVEIDVLVAQALGLTIDQLIEIYRIYFPILQENEAATWYDQNGRIVWTCSKGLPGVGWLDDRGKRPGRAAWDKILADNPAELTCTAIDDTTPGGPRTVTRRFIGPFTTCDRIEDYRCAWAHFERLQPRSAA
jgi:hypothetical protein